MNIPIPMIFISITLQSYCLPQFTIKATTVASLDPDVTIGTALNVGGVQLIPVQVPLSFNKTFVLTIDGVNRIFYVDNLKCNMDADVASPSICQNSARCSLTNDQRMIERLKSMKVAWYGLQTQYQVVYNNFITPFQDKQLTIPTFNDSYDEAFQNFSLLVSSFYCQSCAASAQQIQFTEKPNYLFSSTLSNAIYPLYLYNNVDLIIQAVRGEIEWTSNAMKDLMYTFWYKSLSEKLQKQPSNANVNVLLKIDESGFDLQTALTALIDAGGLEQNKKSASVGLIVGVVIGGAIFIALVVVGAVFLKKYLQRKKLSKNPQNQLTEEEMIVNKMLTKRGTTGVQ